MNLVVYIRINDVIHSSTQITDVSFSTVGPMGLRGAMKGGFPLRDSLLYLFIKDEVYQLDTDLDELPLGHSILDAGMTGPIYLDYKKVDVPKELYDHNSPLYAGLFSKLMDVNNLDLIAIQHVDHKVKAIINKLTYGDKARFSII